MPPPYFAARYGKRQILPNPTDAPAADSTNPSLPENALRFAAACGAAAVFSPGGMGSRAEAERLYALTALAGPAVRRLPAP